VTSGAANLSFLTQFWDSDFSAMPPKLKKQNSGVFEQTSEQAVDFSAMLALISGLAPDLVECLSCVQGSPEAGENGFQSAVSIEAVVPYESNTHVCFTASMEKLLADAEPLLDVPEPTTSETKEVATLSDKPEYGIHTNYAISYEQSSDVDLTVASEITASHSGASSEDDLGFKHASMQERGLGKEPELPTMDQYAVQRISEFQVGDSRSTGGMAKNAAQEETSNWTWPNKEVDSKVVNYYGVITNRDGGVLAGDGPKNDELKEEHFYSEEATDPKVELVKSRILERINLDSDDQAQSLPQENVSSLAEPNRSGIGTSPNAEEVVELSASTGKWLAGGEADADADSVSAMEPKHLQFGKAVDFLKEQAASIQVQEAVEVFGSTSGSMQLMDVEGLNPAYDLDAIVGRENTFPVDPKKEVNLAAQGVEARSKQDANDELSKGQSLKGSEVIEVSSNKAPITDDDVPRSVLLGAERSEKSAEGSEGKSVSSTDEVNKLAEMPPFPSGGSVKETATTTDQLRKGEVFNITYPEMTENVAPRVSYQEDAAADETARMSQDQTAKNVTSKDNVPDEAKKVTDETLFVEENALETLHSREEVSGQMRESGGTAFEQYDVLGAEESLSGKAEKQTQPSKEKDETSAVQRAFESFPRSVEDAAHQDISSSLRPEGQYSPGKLSSDATNVKLSNEALLEQKSSLAMRLAELPLRFGIDVRGGELLLTIMANSDQDASHLKEHSGYIKQRLARKGYEFDAVNVVNSSQLTVQDYKVYHYDMVV